MGSGPIKKNTRQNEKPWSGKKRLTKKKKKKKDKGERKLTRASKNGGCRYGKNKYCGYSRNKYSGYSKKRCRKCGRNGATGMAGAGIPTPAATPSPSKVSASREIGIQMKCKYI